MGKRKDKRASTELYIQILQTAAQSLLAANDDSQYLQGELLVDDKGVAR